MLGASGVSLVLGLCFTRAGRDRLALLAALLGFAFAGLATALLFPFRFPPVHVSNLSSWGLDLSRPVQLVGRLAQDPLPTPSGLELEIQATALSEEPAESWSRPRPVTGRIRLWVATSKLAAAAFPAELPSLRAGDLVEAVVRLNPPRVYHNPGSFDFRHRAESIDDLYWEGTVEGAPRALQSSTTLTLAAALRLARNSLSRAIDQLYPPWSAEGRNGAVLKAILLGDRSALDSGIVEPFRQSGLYHLLVIAGLHVGLLALLVAGGLRLMGLGRTSRNLVLLAVLLMYALIVEQRAPTLRATLMLGIFIVGRLLDRDHTALNAIGLAALALLFARPARLNDSGFQLSFAAALIIAGVAAPVLALTTEPYRRALNKLDDVELDIVLAARAAQFRLDLRSLIAALRGHFAVFKRHPGAAQRLVIWPVWAALASAEIVIFSAILQVGLVLPMVETFHRVTLAGIGLNALALPLMTVLLAVAFPTILLAVLSRVAAALPAKALSLVLAGLFSLTSLPHLPDWLSYRVPAPPPAVALGFALTALAVGIFLRVSPRAALASLVAFALFTALVMIYPFAPKLPANSLEVTALDCGRGQAVFLVLPDGASVLVGAGGSSSAASTVVTRWDPGENIVSPYLWSRGLKELDVFLVSDARDARLDGVLSVLQNFRVRELWCPRGLDTTLPVLSDYPAMLRKARSRGTLVREVFGREVLRVGVASFSILGPFVGAGSGARIEDDSFAFRVSAGRSSALIAVSLSTGAEQQILESGSEIQSEVLTAPRGLADSPQHWWFLEKVSPKIIIQTAEARGEMVEPSPGPEASAAGAPLFSISRDGAVTAEMKESSLRISTFRRGRGGYVIP